MKRDGEGAGSGRRRLRGEGRRRRQVVVRFSDAELVLVRERAALGGLAVGAWIGDTVLGAATRGADDPVGLLDLVRLHADVVAIAGVDGIRHEDVVDLLVRIDAAIDAIVDAIDRAPR